MRKNAWSLVIAVIFCSTFLVSSTAFSYCCYRLYIPFLTQVPPGDWDNTKNCGQTCAVMLGGYFNATPVNSSEITEQNKWLAMYTGDKRYNSPNGWYTGGSSLTAYRQILLNVHHLKTSVYYGKDIYDILNYGCQQMPVIVGVLIKKGKLVSNVKDKDAASHWAIVVGCDGNKVILNDPGTNSGNGIKYDVATFTSSWATQGKIYMPVRR